MLLLSGEICLCWWWWICPSRISKGLVLLLFHSLFENSKESTTEKIEQNVFLSLSFFSFGRLMGLMQWQELGLLLTTEVSSAATTCSGLSSTGCTLENLIHSTTPWTTMSYSQHPMRSRSTMRNAGISHQFQRTGRSSPRATTKPWGQVRFLLWSAP